MRRYLFLFAIALGAYLPVFAQQRPVLVASALLVAPYDSVSYTHSNGRETTVKVNEYMDHSYFDLGFDISNKWSFDHFNGNQRVYKLSGTEKRSYNTDNSLASYYIDYFDANNSSKTAYYNHDYTYNPNKTIDSIFYESFATISAPKPWKVAEKYVYDNLARLIRKHSLSWDSTLSIWVDGGASDSFLYNSNAQLEKHVTNDWAVKYSYDNNGLKMADTALWGWQIYSDLWVYDYFPGALLKSKEHLQYDLNQHIWIPYEKYTYDYTGNNCTAITNWDWDKASSTYVQGYKTDYLYNIDNQVVQAGDIHYYYAFPTTVPGTTLKTQYIDIYPSPATTYINLNLNFDNPQSLSVIIFDMQGRMVKQFKDKADKTYHKNIIVQDMPAGQYMLQVKTNGETLSKNFTIIR